MAIPCGYMIHTTSYWLKFQPKEPLLPFSYEHAREGGGHVYFSKASLRWKPLAGSKYAASPGFLCASML